MSNPTQTAIIWPPTFLPGTTDNFVSNEVIARGVTAAQVWPLLADVSRWPSYYRNCDDVTPPPSSATRGGLLQKDDHFRFSTFGFPALDAYVRECVAPAPGGAAGRLAWHAPVGDGAEVYHAWVVEDLPGGRVRVLTQESQVGDVFAQFARDKPNKMLLGHQDWLEGLVQAARGEEVTTTGSTNLGSVGAWERRT